VPHRTTAKVAHAIFLTLPLALLCGCHHQTQRAQAEVVEESARLGQVSAQPVEPKLEARYTVQAGARYEQPTAFPDNPMPEYPGSLLAARLPPVELKLRLVINEQGRVSATKLLNEIPVAHQPFFSSARATVQSWKFLPLIEISEGEGSTTVTVHEFTTSYPGKATALPFHQDYVFVFRQVNGSPSVTVE
jgi:hypothetical protein